MWRLRLFFDNIRYGTPLIKSAAAASVLLVVVGTGYFMINSFFNSAPVINVAGNGQVPGVIRNADGTITTGNVSNGAVNNGAANNGTANNGAVNNGTVNNGTSNNGTASNGNTNSGTANNGTVSSGSAASTGTTPTQDSVKPAQGTQPLTYIQLSTSGKSLPQVVAILNESTKKSISTLGSPFGEVADKMRENLEYGLSRYYVGKNALKPTVAATKLSQDLIKAGGSIADSIKILVAGGTPGGVELSKLTGADIRFDRPMSITYAKGATFCSVDLTSYVPAYLENASCK